jgi:hypothetical protein
MIRYQAETKQNTLVFFMNHNKPLYSFNIDHKLLPTTKKRIVETISGQTFYVKQHIPWIPFASDSYFDFSTDSGHLLRIVVKSGLFKKTSFIDVENQITIQRVKRASYNIISPIELHIGTIYIESFLYNYIDDLTFKINLNVEGFNELHLVFYCMAYLLIHSSAY